MAIFINREPPQDPNVQYDGKTLPKDKVPLANPPIDPNVQYAGKILPQDALPYIPPTVDQTNNPSLINIGGIYLPQDTEIYLNGRKVLAESQIIDGVSVFEHILRKPYEIEFNVVVRESTAIPGSNFDPFVSPTSNAFPQSQLNYLWYNIWTPNTVNTITNTYLNGLGIQEIIISDISPATVRGSKNIPLRIRAFENQPGLSIII